MPLFNYGQFQYACRNIPSLPICNLFFRQMLVHPAGETAPAYQILGFSQGAEFDATLSQYGVGVDAACYIRRMGAAGGASGSLGNIANIILCGIAVLVGLGLAAVTIRRYAAVGRVEMTVLCLMYAAVQALQLLDTGAIFRAGSNVLVWLTGAHIGLIVGFFWVLLWCAFLSLQIVEDGTLLSLVPMFAVGTIVTIGTAYIALDTAFAVSAKTSGRDGGYFQSIPAAALQNNWLFSTNIVWPGAAALAYYVIQLGVIARVLREKKPALLFTASAISFILSQGAYFALSYKICTGTKNKVDGSFLATLLETVAIVLLWFGWKSITEDSWDGKAENFVDDDHNTDQQSYEPQY